MDYSFYVMVGLLIIIFIMIVLLIRIKKKSVLQAEAVVDNNNSKDTEAFDIELNKVLEQVSALELKIKEQNNILRQKENILQQLTQEKHELKQKLQFFSEKKEKVMDGKITEKAIAEIGFEDTKEKETENLVSKIANLNEEIEDLRDDIENNEQKIKRYRAESNEYQTKVFQLEDNLSSAITEKEVLENHMKRELKTLDQKRAYSEAKLSSAKESLTFVNTIINAEELSDKNYKKIQEHVNNISNIIMYRIIHCSDSMNYDYFDGLSFDQNYLDSLFDRLDSWVESEIKPWTNNKKTIAIVGEFSSGKTSIVNKILSHDDINAIQLPINSKETTAIPTYISYAPDFICSFFTPDYKRKNLDKKAFETLTKSMLDKVKVGPLIKYFVLGYKNPHLKNISILDTPGFGSVNDDIIERTTEVVREADAIFWIIDANAGGLNQTSTKVMKKHLNGMPLYFVINKADTKSKADLNALEKVIATTATKNDIKYEKIIRFSKNENVKILLNTIQGIKYLEDSSLMSEILIKLEELEQKVKSHRDDLTNQKKSSDGKIINIHDRVGEIQNTVSRKLYSIKSDITSQESFWGGAYKIDKGDYQVLVRNINSINDDFMNFNEKFGWYSDAVKENVKCNTEHAEITADLRFIQNTLEEFKSSINAYNPNLLNVTISNESK